MENKKTSIDDIFDGTLDAKYRRTYLGDWGPTEASSGSQRIDPLHARIEAAGSYVLPTHATEPEWAPWDDPFKDVRQKAEDRIAVMGDPDPLRMDAPIPVYCHDRWAEKPWNVLTDEAVELLRDKKRIDIRVIDKQVGYRGVRLSYIVYRNNLRVESEVLLKPKIFDRTEKTELDGQAGLKKEMDTHTYILLRIAYVLLQAYKLNDRDAGKIDLPIVRVFKHTTMPVYRF